MSSEQFVSVQLSTVELRAVQISSQNSKASFPSSEIQSEAERSLKSHLMKMIEDIMKDINNSLKEIQDDTGKQVEALKEETEKSLKE